MQRTYRARTTDGVDIAYRVEGSGPPLVLVHGLGDDQRVYQPLVERLGGHNTCISLDLRGHGSNGRAPITTLSVSCGICTR